MPSSLRQQGMVFLGTDKNGRKKYLLIARRTGFMDVWIGGQHFYYNYTQSYNDASEIDVNQVIQDYNDQENAKKTIVIRRR